MEIKCKYCPKNDGAGTCKIDESSSSYCTGNRKNAVIP